MRAVKGNKEYSIDETQKKSYQDSGFDILDADGKVIAYGRGKTVTADAHMQAVKEIERLQQLAADRYAEIEALQAETVELKAEIEVLRAAKPDSAKKTESKKVGE